MTSRRAARRLAAFTAAAALLGAACSGGSDAADTASDPSPSEQTSDAATLLSFTSPLVGGGEIDVATLADTPTVLWFWSPT